jgi:F-type H+-transporting ATPase subunit b
MELVTPGIGLIFWMTLSFGLVLFILRKFAWTPILGTIKERENFIAQSLENSKKIEREMEELEATKERMILKSKQNADEIIHQAKLDGEKIIGDAQEKAREEAAKIVDAAKSSINSQRKMVENEIRQQIIALSVEMAQKVLKEEFADQQKKSEYVSKLLDDMKLN